MLRKFLYRCSTFMNGVLENPPLVLGLSALFVLFSLVFDGTLFQLWTLNRESSAIQGQIESLDKKILDLEDKIAKAQKLEYVEKAAISKFNLVEDGDLIFIFTDSNDRQKKQKKEIDR